MPTPFVRGARSASSALPRALLALPATAVLLALAGTSPAAPGADEPWRTETTVDGSEPTVRHEAAGVAVDGRMYLLGGRRIGSATVQRVDVYDPDADTWTDLGPMPADLHHFQAVAVGQEIWIVGALTGDYPNEPPVAEIHVYDTVARTWRVPRQVPAERRRGSAAAVLHDDGLIYVLGGNTEGHAGGAVPWFDTLDPATLEWQTLPDAPNARDHFSAAIVDGRLVATAGRATALPNPFANTIAPTDVYDLGAGTWTSVADIPTERAGAFTVGRDGEVIAVGGEAAGDENALDVAEAFDVGAGTWRTLRPLNVGRHAGGAAVLGDRLHVVAGSGIRGGQNLADHESLDLDSDETRTDTDGDGLSDEEEAERGTNPEVADTDGDGLDDGAEASGGTDPLLSDTDSDGIDDATERAEGTDPLDPEDPSGGEEDGGEDTAGGEGSGGEGTTGGEGSGGEGTAGGEDSGGGDTGGEGTGDSEPDTAGEAPDGDEDGDENGKRKSGGGGAFGALSLLAGAAALAGRTRRRRVGRHVDARRSRQS